jgi:hypothetical protein
MDRKTYNWPIAGAGILLCSYMLYVFQKFFSSRIALYDDYMEIHKPGKMIAVRYDDILDIWENKNVCYIIDRINIDGKHYLRGSKHPISDIKDVKKIKVNSLKLISLQRAYLHNYDDIIEFLASRCSVERKLKNFVEII